MKRYLLYALAAVLSIASCSPFTEEKPIDLIQTTVPTLELVETQDSTFSFKITATAETSYYSFLVLQGKKTELDSNTVFAASNEEALVAATVNAQSRPDTTVLLEKLVPNTTYSVYAVAGNSQGVPGSVVALEVLTTDNLVPTIEDFDADEKGQYTVTFNEPIRKGKAFDMSVHYYRRYPSAAGEPFIKKTVPADSIRIDGNEVCIAVPDPIPGAYAFVTWKPGSFTNMVNTPDRGYEKILFDPDGKKIKGIVTHIENQDWEIVWKDENEAKDTIVNFSDPSKVAFLIDLTDRNLPGIVDGEVNVTTTFTDPDNSLHTYPLKDNVTILYHPSSADMAYLFLPGAPGFASTVGFQIPEHAFLDEWGNGNKAYVRENAYRRLVESTGIAGTYMVSATSIYGDSYTWNVAIVKEEGKETYAYYNPDPYIASLLPNKMVTGCTYDDATGNFTIPSGTELAGMKDGSKILQYGINLEGESIPEILLPKTVLKMDEKGWLKNTTGFGTVRIKDPADVTTFIGFFDIYEPGIDFIKISNDPQLMSTAISSENKVELPEKQARSIR